MIYFHDKLLNQQIQTTFSTIYIVFRISVSDLVSWALKHLWKDAIIIDSNRLQVAPYEVNIPNYMPNQVHLDPYECRVPV